MEIINEMSAQKLINLIIRRRNELKITLTELAIKSGLSELTISEIESNKSIPSLDTLIKILTILNVDLLLIDNDVIKTNRLILRKFKKDDAQEMYESWCNDPEVTKFMTWNKHENIGVTQMILDDWIKQYGNPETIRYGITLKDSGKLIGSIDVTRYKDGNPEIGYCLSRKYWNNGYTTEACKAFIEYLFKIGFNKILIQAVVDNFASNRVIEKCGFSFTHQEIKTPWSSFKPESVKLNCYEIKRN